jgi:hypothetical protein
MGSELGTTTNVNNNNNNNRRKYKNFLEGLGYENANNNNSRISNIGYV